MLESGTIYCKKCFLLLRDIKPVHQFVEEVKEKQEESNSKEFSGVNAMSEAKDYAQFSISETLAHRFYARGNRRYHCAARSCPARREIVQKSDSVNVVSSGEHNHDHVAEAKNKYIPRTWHQVIKKTRLANLTPVQLQALNPEIVLSTTQLNNMKKYENKKRTLATWEDWQKKVKRDSRVLASHIKKDEEVIILSSTSMIKTAFGDKKNASFMCIDANVDHFKKDNQNGKKKSTYTLLMVGTRD
jgi:hypothetical protein